MGSDIAYVLALDLGSTNLKARLYAANQGQIADGSLPLTYLVNGVQADGVYHAELDPELVWEATVGLIRSTCEKGRIATRELDRIAVTSQAQTFALLAENGTPLTPFYSWLDCRGEAYLADIRDELGHCFHRHCSFPAGLAEMQLAKVLWLRDTAPHLLHRAARVIELPSYAMLRLAGLSVLDSNLAGMSGLYSLLEQRWWPAALRMCGITTRQLPVVLPLGAGVSPRLSCPDLALPPDLRVILAGNDHTAGAFGNDCTERDVMVTLGTALVAYRVAGSTPGPYSLAGCWGPYPGGAYYELAVLSYGSVALDWAREQLLPGESVDAFTAVAQRGIAPAVPLSADGTPFFYPACTGTESAWIGTGTREQRALAVFEGIGFALRQLIADGLGLVSRPESITVVGGGSRSALWRQVLADILGCTVRVGHGDACTGAARMATRDASGFPELRQGGGEPDAATVAQPHRDAHQRYDRLYPRWQRGGM